MIEEAVVIIGAGGHAEVVASTLIAAGMKVFGFYDDDRDKWGKLLLGIPVLGGISDLPKHTRIPAIMGVGDNAIRKRLVQQLELDWVTAIHPFAWVHPEAHLGAGTVVCAGSIVQPGAWVGEHVILNTKASVDHHCQVGDYSHIAVSHLAGGGSVDEGVFMALGSIVFPGVHVGAWATVGAGAVATHDVPPGITVVGSPARDIRRSHRERKPQTKVAQETALA